MTLRSWFRTLLDVIVVEPRVLWFALVVPVIVIGVATAVGPASGLSRRLTSGASVLQILGIFQVAYGLHGLRVELGQPTLRTLFKRWAAKVRSLFGVRGFPALHASATGSATASATLSARGVGVDPTSMESRVAALEKRVAWLEGDLSDQIGEVNRRVDDLSSDLQSERVSRSAETTHLRQLLTRLFVGGLDLEAAGLAWILFGQVLATWPDWFASLALLQRLTN
jgi:hypothetical protein